MDFIQQLQVFVTVVDSGSFARAAEALRMGRPSVTNTVSALESAIGARLLHRTTRRSSLTGEGELFYERATRILADVEEARDLFGGSGQHPKGRLRVDIPVAPPSLTSFRTCPTSLTGIRTSTSSLASAISRSIFWRRVWTAYCVWANSPPAA